METQKIFISTIFVLGDKEEYRILNVAAKSSNSSFLLKLNQEQNGLSIEVKIKREQEKYSESTRSKYKNFRQLFQR